MLKTRNALQMVAGITLALAIMIPASAANAVTSRRMTGIECTPEVKDRMLYDSDFEPIGAVVGKTIVPDTGGLRYALTWGDTNPMSVYCRFESGTGPTEVEHGNVVSINGSGLNSSAGAGLKMRACVGFNLVAGFSCGATLSSSAGVGFKTWNLTDPATQLAPWIQNRGAFPYVIFTLNPPSGSNFSILQGFWVVTSTP